MHTTRLSFVVESVPTEDPSPALVARVIEGLLEPLAILPGVAAAVVDGYPDRAVISVVFTSGTRGEAARTARVVEGAVAPLVGRVLHVAHA